MNTYLTREQFEPVRQLMEDARKATRPRIHDLYDVMHAIIYRRVTRVSWRQLPDDFPPWRTVHEYQYQWSMIARDGGRPVLDVALEKLAAAGVQINPEKVAA